MRTRHPQGLVATIGSMIVWAVWFALVYALAGVGCEAGWDERPLLGANLLSIVLLASTLLALAAIGACARRGYATWRSADLDTGRGVELQQRARFMGRLSLVLSVIAATGTILVAIPILMLSPCQA